MSRIINGFKDPVRRPRFIIWTGTILIALVAFVIVALGVTSTYWFCSSVCHTVQDDSINAYNRSTHAKVSCMDCHMPVNTDPVSYVLHKAEALGELYLTATNDYELPLNKGDHLAMTGFSTTHCTQCHALENRKITPSPDIIIDHDVHAQKGIRCTWCHNRIAHNEDGLTTVSIDPQTGKPPVKQNDFMTMNGCFRCHSLEPGAAAPGDCAACHPSNFDLKPANHKSSNFMSQHGKMAEKEDDRVKEATAEIKKEEESGKKEHDVGDPTDNYPLPKDYTEVNTCYTCHSKKFCDDCHGTPMPHPADFKTNHAKEGQENPKSCEKCHGASNTSCDSCHHGTEIGFDAYNPNETFIPQHVAAVQKVGATKCFECHDPTYCATCHVNGGKMPPNANVH